MAKQVSCVCAECGRTKTHQGRGLCGACRGRLLRAGTLDERYPRRTMPFAERAAKYEAELGREACWPWPTTNNSGYGQHRKIYEAVIGPVPEGYTLDHVVCDRRDCANPHHLKAVTHRENLLRSGGMSAQNARKERCPYGHSYDGVTIRGARICRRCNNIRAAARRRARRDGTSYVDPLAA